MVIGAGSIGQAVARRVSAGKHVLLADLRAENAAAAAQTLSDAGFDVSTAQVDVSSRASVHALAETATSIGAIVGLIHAAGVSPSQALPETILKVDMYGTALVLEEFGNVIARGGCGRRDRVTIRPSSSAALGRAEQGAGHDADRRVTAAADAAGRSNQAPGDSAGATLPT